MEGEKPSSPVNPSAPQTTEENIQAMEDASEYREKIVEIDEETNSSTGTKTTDDDGSTAHLTSSSYSTSENTIDKDPESHSNECEKALEILKEFAKLGETTPKKDYSFGVDVDDRQDDEFNFEGSSSVERVENSIEVLKISEPETAPEVSSTNLETCSDSKDTQEESAKESLNAKELVDFEKFKWNPNEPSSALDTPKQLENVDSTDKSQDDQEKMDSSDLENSKKEGIQNLSEPDSDDKQDSAEDVNMVEHPGSPSNVEDISEIESVQAANCSLDSDKDNSTQDESSQRKENDTKPSEYLEIPLKKASGDTQDSSNACLKEKLVKDEPGIMVEIPEVKTEPIDTDVEMTETTKSTDQKSPDEIKKEKIIPKVEPKENEVPPVQSTSAIKPLSPKKEIKDEKVSSTPTVKVEPSPSKKESKIDKPEESVPKTSEEPIPSTKEDTNKDISMKETKPAEPNEDLLPEEMDLLKQAEANEANETNKQKNSSSSSSDSDDEYFTGKECINTNCNGKSVKFVKAHPTAIRYFYAKEKKQVQYVCRRCRSKVFDSFISMSEMLLKGEPLLGANRPRKSDFVQLIDSSDEEQDESQVEVTDGEHSLDEDTLELIDSSLIPTIKSVFKQIGMKDQIRQNEQILQTKIDNVNKQADFLLSGLSGLQKEADAIGQRIYSCTKVNYKNVAPVDCGNLILADASNFVPPMGPIEFPEVMVNSAYFGQVRDSLAPWVKGKVIYKEKNSVYSFSFACNGRFTQRSMAKKNLAYLEPPEKRVDTGARVIALYDTFRLQGKLQGSTCWMVGIVAEPAKSQNKYRYLIFFDNGYAQYVSHSEIRLICGPSQQVWEDVHVSNRDFIKDYLQQYQFHRPMVRTQIGQKMLTRWDGRFFNSTVVDIDCSLIRMQSDRDSQKIEWLYRGSKRLEPVYKAYRKEQSEKLQRDMQAKTQHAQQMRRQELNPPTNLATVAAKKKTYATRQPPQPVKHLNNAIIYVDDEPNSKGKIEYLTVKQDRQPKPYKPHECSKKCLLDMNYKQLKTYSPLAKPLICGWSRQIFKGKGRKFVVYKTPCGFSCRNMQAVHMYLRQTKNPLNVESFDFSWEVNCLAQYEDKSYELRIDDLSNGLEQMPVECVNYYDKTLPPPCEYSTKRIPTEGVNLNLDEDFLVGCDCEGDCSIRKDCACWQLTLRATKFFNLNAAEVGYHNKRLYDGVSTGIYECNSRCKCSSQCVNRVVQHPLELKLQVFKTNNRGWGIRCLNDIPKGCFICVYAGNLLTEQNANEGGKDTGDEYFAELDYIEVVEKQKEGYESDAESMSQSDSEDEYNPASGDLEWRSSSASKRQARRSTAITAVNREQRDRKKNKFFEEEDSPKKYKSIRKYYGNNEACYVMDAKVTGNLGRYFNHSCDPNLYVQNVFVDTHDLRFPWVAFFSSKFIRAGTELTWNYNYEVGVVPGKVLYCECGAFNCRGRLL